MKGAGNATPYPADLGGLWASRGVGTQAGMWSNDVDWVVLTESYAEIGERLDLMVDEDTPSATASGTTAGNGSGISYSASGWRLWASMWR